MERPTVSARRASRPASGDAAAVTSSDDDDKAKKATTAVAAAGGSWRLPRLVKYVLLAAVAVSVLAALRLDSKVSWVWFYAGTTAVSTGLGALPFCFVSKLSSVWVGVSNALAAGMMAAASCSLVAEGWLLAADESSALISIQMRVVVGVAAGVLFIVATQHYIDGADDMALEDGALSTGDVRKTVLILAVMTLHSFTEGVSIGVAYKSDDLGHFITASLAIHNIPEGLAVSLVLVPRGASVAAAALWSIFSSIPQPVMAVPAYLFVEQFLAVLPVGLGFAAGAMAWVAIMELYVEALEELHSHVKVATTATLAGIAMLCLQYAMRGV